MKIDKTNPVIQKLFSVSDSGEGSLYHNSDPEIDAQTDFIAEVIEYLRPMRILEIGTHKGFFGHFILSNWNHIAIDTCDIAPWSADAVKILKEAFPVAEINFTLGDSGEVVKNYSKRAGLAWVDGYHDEKKTLSDLQVVEEKKIGNILVDDFYMRCTQNAVFRFCLEHQDYWLHSVSKDVSRKIACLRKIGA